MAIDLGSYTDEEIAPPPQRDPNGFSLWDGVKRFLDPIASLRLTVVLFALSIFLVLAGTFAQVDKDIWEVVGQYFRCWFAWVPFVIFFPPSFVPEMPTNPEEVSMFGRLGISTMQGLKSLAESSGGFWFPGGKLIGLCLAANLVAAHTVRFKAQAKGTRLLAGLGALAAGIAITWLVISSAGNSKGFQTKPSIPYSTLWIGYQSLTLFISLGAAYLAAITFIKSAGRRRTISQWFGIGLLVWFSLKFGALSGLIIFGGAAYRPSDASMRILWQLTQGSFASASLLLGCWVVFGKRSGIVLLHSGIGLMMFYELHVAMTAVETQMQLEEGETTNFVSDIRTFELAVIDKSNPKEEQVTAIPRSMITRDCSLDLKNLPFKIEVKDVVPNSNLRAASSKDSNPATTGLGVEWFAEPKKQGTGTDADSKVDMAAAYVALTDRATNKPLGTFLVGMLLSMSNETDQIHVDGKTYELALRPQRHYKPYQFRLGDVSKKDYLGTSTPKSYASTVHIGDPSRNVDEEKTIWMNNPLRFADETFYQSGYFPASASSGEHTTLSVVANSGWMMPYVACALVALGMAVHFLTMLVRFLMKSDLVAPSVTTSKLAEKLKMKPAAKAEAPLAGDKPGYGPAIAASVMATMAIAYIAVVAMPPKKKELDYDLYRFGQIPVVQDGRVKPIDTAAYSALLTISGRSKVEVGEGKDQIKIPATRWLLDVIGETKAADDYHVFRIENLEVQDIIGVKKREGMRYSRNEIGEKESEFRKQVIQAREANKKDKRQLSIFQRKILELDEKLTTFDTLKFAFGLQHRIRGKTAEDVIQSFQNAIRFEKMLSEEGQPIFAVPPAEKDGKWKTFAGAWLENVLTSVRDKKEANPVVTAWNTILSDYSNSEDPKGEKKVGPPEFNKAVDDYLKLLNSNPPPDVNLKAIRFETFFNHFKPFTQADVLYLVAFVLGACGWLGWSRGFNKMAFWLLVVTLCVHTFAIVSRIYISGRPPVTNLYSSAVFIGWGCVVLGLILEIVFRLGIGNLIASVAGYATLLIADGLSLGGDTFTVLTAVLDTQFWLATHVTTITLGYATTYLAGLLGVVYVLRGALTPSLTPAIGKDISRMIYGTLCFSIFFSFVGTVLGGLWADDSWGRFWGWDPKENGALIIVLWNALVLHARWGGMVKDRGMAVLAIGGNIFVSWSWWGVNELGAGLHSYGFTAGTVLRLGAFVASQLVLIGIGMIPKRLWFSSRRNAAV
ncbi:MAG: cytochrome c assembly protein [Schlesneria sp.]|nr:cytochrome c assembly protein [Schlesneria sp.]